MTKQRDFDRGAYADDAAYLAAQQNRARNEAEERARRKAEEHAQAKDPEQVRRDKWAKRILARKNNRERWNKWAANNPDRLRAKRKLFNNTAKHRAASHSWYMRNREWARLVREKRRDEGYWREWWARHRESLERNPADMAAWREKRNTLQRARRERKRAEQDAARKRAAQQRQSDAS